MDFPAEVREDIHAAPFDKVADLWAIMEEAYGDDARVWLAKNDRYYLLTRVCKRLDAVHPWLFARCREVERDPDGYLDLWARNHYKALALDTPVPTPFGWKNHGDLVPGDWVYGSDGQPTEVVAKTEVFTDSDCYEVQFDDGEKIVCSSQHLWTVQIPDRRRVPGTNKRRGWKTVTVDTKTLQTHQRDARIPVAPAVFNAEHMLPMQPYTLGAWLGDGANATGRITCGDLEVYAAIRAEGYEHSPLKEDDRSCQSCTIYGTGAVLRDMGLLHNKHIPEEYLISSVAQRRALLQGLMDTDGSCTPGTGEKCATATFVNKHEPLARSVYDLCMTLGLKPRINQFEYDHGTVYQVCFAAYREDEPFKIARKLARCSAQEKKASSFRRVWAVLPAGSVPVSCIQVAAADGLYLAGRHHVTTHNSTIITFAGIIQEILKDPEITIGIFSHTKPIAKAFLKQIQQELERNEDLLKLFPGTLYDRPDRDSSSWSLDGGLVVRRKSNPKEPTVYASGLVDGQPTSKHFKLLVYDDVVTPSSVSTPEQIAKTTEAWELSDNLSMVGGRKWHIGTRYSYADTYQAMMDRNAIKVRLYAATADGAIDGDPVFLSQEEWDKKVRDQGEATISCQMLQNPLAGQQRMFNVEDVREYEIRPMVLNVYIMVDPARSKKKGSDKTAVAVIGLDYARNKYLLDGFNHKMDLRERWVRTAQMYHRWKRAPGVQNIKVGYESFGAQADLDYFKEQMQKPDSGGHFPIEELAWPRDGEGSKIDRVQRLGPDIRAHKLFTPHPTDPNNLTSLQRRMNMTGYDYRIAQSIKRKDESNKIYDLSKDLRAQIHFFPFGGKKDLIDACSRIYDMEPYAPSFSEPSYLEPEYT